MRKGQASAEQLMILGAVMVVALVVIALLMYSGIDTSEEKLSTASAAYWSNAQPIAIREASGGPIGSTGYVSMATGFLVTFTNTGKAPITLRSIDISGSISQGIWIPAHIFAAERISGCSVADCTYLDNENHVCNFVLNPSEEVTLMLFPAGNPKCSGDTSGGDSINSVRKSALVPVSIWYGENGLLQLEKGAVNLYVQCDDYWACSTTADCNTRYGCSSGCENGACTPGSCSFCPD